MGNESEVFIKARKVKEASYKAVLLNANQRTKILLSISAALDENRKKIFESNQKDIQYAKETGLSDAMIDRLLLNDARIDEMIKGLKEIAMMPDILGNIENVKKLDNGLLVGQMWAPLGAIAIIYESRPNVTVDAAALCIKSGNTILLRGGKEAINSNLILVEILKNAAIKEGFPEEGIQIIENTDRTLVNELVTLRQFIDVLIPRGSQAFIDHIYNISKVPIIETGAGNCHTYVDEEADLKMAEEIVFNAKTQRPSVCNATKKVILHSKIAEEFIKLAKPRLLNWGVEFLADERALPLIKEAKPITEAQWYEEFLDKRLGVKIVDSVDEAIIHINHYGSHHSDAIITNNYPKALRFINAVDSASVFWNASTRFTDGGQFGLGAEIGISTQKLHWRGPMSIGQLMNKKFVTLGTGQIRK
jgi:glutamate-5-semialdehyde dehydrogenase